MTTRTETRALVRAASTALATALVLSLAACSGEPVDPDRDVLSPGLAHTHDTIVGDGTTTDAGGYSLTDVTLPRRTREPGDLSFVLRDSSGQPLADETDYVEEQTKLLHLYVVRDDLADFRHLHPVLGDDGTWTARVDLADPGRYRVVAEFAPSAEDEGTKVVVGERVVVPGEWEPAPAEDIGSTGTDGLVSVTFPDSLVAGRDSGFDVTVSDGAGGQLNLGSYLGSYAHVTGFDVDTGAFVHAHPLGAPTPTADGSTLQFHTELPFAGNYRFFVQVRVDGFVHTVEVGSTVG